MKQLVLIPILLMAVIGLHAQRYNQQEVQKLKCFFAQASAVAGKTNREALGITNIADPGTWKGVDWQKDVSNGKRVKSIAWRGESGKPIVAGILDLSDFSALVGLYCEYNQITSINPTGSTHSLFS